MSAAPKSPAELIADLTDQVRLLRQDVGSLTTAAPTKAEAARLMASVQKAANEAFERSQHFIAASEQLSRRMHQDSASAAQVAAERAIKGLEHEIQAAANRMRLEAVRGRQQALYGFGGGFGCLRRHDRSGSRSGRPGVRSDSGARRCTGFRKISGGILQVGRG